MKRQIAIIMIVITNLFLSSCRPGQLFGPTITPTPMNTSTPTLTTTPTLTSTTTPTFTADNLNNIVTPRIIDPYGLIIDWGNIPLMPGAIPGELRDRTYSFKIKVKPDEVKNYYETELIEEGWNIVKFQQDPTLTITPESMIMIQARYLFQFTGWDHQLLTFNIDYQNEISYVEIVFGTYGSYY